MSLRELSRGRLACRSLPQSLFPGKSIPREKEKACWYYRAGFFRGMLNNLLQLSVGKLIYGSECDGASFSDLNMPHCVWLLREHHFESLWPHPSSEHRLFQACHSYPSTWGGLASISYPARIAQSSSWSHLQWGMTKRHIVLIESIHHLSNKSVIC